MLGDVWGGFGPLNIDNILLPIDSSCGAVDDAGVWGLDPDWAAVEPVSISPIENPNSPPDGLVPVSVLACCVGCMDSDWLLAGSVEELGDWNAWDELLCGGWLCVGRGTPLWSSVCCLCKPLGLDADVSEPSVQLGFICCFCVDEGSVLNRLLIDPKRFETPVGSLLEASLPGKELEEPDLIC